MKDEKTNLENLLAPLRLIYIVEISDCLTRSRSVPNIQEI